jgi:uncharacterized membrane protein
MLGQQNLLTQTFLHLGITLVCYNTALGESSPPMFMPFEALPGFGNSLPSAISADATTVVGVCTSFENPQSFYWNNESGIVGLGWLPNSDGNSAQAVSGDGSVIVGAIRVFKEKGGDYQYLGYRWNQKEGMQIMPGFADATGGIARGVSGDGQVIVGNSGIGPNCTMGYRWTEATGLVAVGSLPPNTDSQIYGISANGAVLVGNTDVCSEFQRAIRWTSSVGMQPLTIISGINPTAFAASATGAVIVGAHHGGAFRWTAATSGHQIPDMSFATSVSADGSAIVGVDDSYPTGKAVVRTEDCGTRLLRDMLMTAGVLEVSNWQLVVGYDIADDNRTIVGTGFNPQGIEQGFLARLPRKGDHDFDGDVDVDDLLKVINSWGPCPPGTCTFLDVNCDGTVGLTDLNAVIDNWDL